MRTPVYRQRSLKQRVIGALHTEVKHAMSLHIPMLPIAQDTTSSRKMRDEGHVCETHPERHERLKLGMPPPPKLKQPNTHIRLSPQLFSSHMPQSLGQLMQSSKRDGSQRMFPQNAQEPQSAGQLAQFSVPLQRPSPQPMQRPQSSTHVKQLSPDAASHMPSPQGSHSLQSAGHEKQSSVP